MAKKKKNRKRSRRKLAEKQNNNLKSRGEDNYLPQPLNIIAKRRKGGSVNLKGLSFQIYSAIWKILQFLTDSDNNRTIRLEGIEDIDIINDLDTTKVHLENAKEYEFIQVKHSENKMDASAFWNKNILQNFIEVYLENPEAKFRLVYNMDLADGNLKELASNSLTRTGLEYWGKKIEDFRNSAKASKWNWTNFETSNFLGLIKFERLSQLDLERDCKQSIIDKFQITTGNEHQYLNTLLVKVFHWSKNQLAISSKDINTVVQEVKDDMAKGVINPATQQGWITKVAYNNNLNISPDDYYEGKAAKPIHIAKGLPVRREYWEEQIENNIKDVDITVLRSSSGQGKSTLAWQVGKTFSENGYTLYELHRCSNEEKIGSIISFLESRVKIGEIPLIIIDGLRQSVSKWFSLTERIYELPIKILITTMEEDWYRYGADASRLSLKHLKIHMSDREAQSIFNQFKAKNKLHHSIQNWQPAWERVKEKGLLIEFVYLITFGKMIQERLENQIHELNKDSASAAKIEILRLVTLADICGVKIRSSDLIKKIQSEIGFQTDRNKVLKSLENEYYIKFDNVYVEGLHLVRSEHLSTILHSNIPIDNSLIELMCLVEPEYVYNFFSTIPKLVSESEKHRLYVRLASCIVNKPFEEITKAIDGIFSGSVLRYWEENKDLYDEAFDSSILLFFVADSIPWMELNTLKGFNESIPNNEIFNYFIRKLDELESFQKEEFDVFIFLTLLQHILKERDVNDEYEGLGTLILWFSRFNYVCPLIEQINEKIIVKALQVSDIQVSSKLALSLNITDPARYKLVAEKNKDQIISLLKVKTNSLTITESDGNIHIKYILSEDSDHATNESVNRINYTYSFLPYYEKYCTEAIMQPIPGKEYMKNLPDDSIKMMPRETVERMLNSEINQLWSKTILSKYEYSSVFEWQKAWYNIRKEALSFIKNANRLFETLIEGNRKRLRSLSHNVDQSNLQLTKTLSSTKYFPGIHNLDSDSTRFSNELKDVDNWKSPLSNFVTRMINIILPQQDNDRRLATINLQDTKNKIPIMQNAFTSICNQTFRYFDFSELEEEEKMWYERIFKTISYYLENQNTEIRIQNANTVIDNWWSNKLKVELNQLYEILDNFERNSRYTVHKPNKITEDGILIQTVIGISGVNFKNFGAEIDDIVIQLSDLSNLEVHFHILAFIEKDGNCMVGTRVNQDTFRKVKEHEELNHYDYGYIFSFTLSDEILEQLDGVVFKQPIPNLTLSLLADLISELWELAETRTRLDETNKIESEWLTELENTYKMKIEKLLEQIEISCKDDFSKYKDISTKIVDRKIQPTEQYFSDLINEVIIENTI